jgi:hypothetical protein
VRRLSPRTAGLGAIVVLVLAAGTVMQASGWNQSSHYALTKSLAAGTATIDPYRHWTGDKARFRGHWYSSRAPGLALLSVPAYEALELLGVPEAAAASGVLRREAEAIWTLGLWAALGPFAAILLLVRWLADRLEPGLGAPAAVALGAGTLLLPFSTMLFSHVLSAALAFAAFALLWREREAPPRLSLVAVAGALVGLGVATEYPIVFAGVVLGLYALSRVWRPADLGAGGRLAPVLARGAAYAGGVVAGVLPLLGYNWLAFGSPTHLAYADLKEHEAGFFGITVPNPAVAGELLFSSRGLLTLAPVLVLAAFGIALLQRRGRRAEALTIGGVSLAFLIYNAGYYLPFGGEVPGPRFLISALPFLGVPLALALRRAPGPAVSLAVASAVTMGVATITDPLIENEADTGSWWALLATRGFQETVVSALGIGTGRAAALPFAVGIGAALVLAWAAGVRAGLALSGRQAAIGVAAVVVWGTLAVLVPQPLGIDASAGSRIVAAGGSAAPEVEHGPLPLLELVALAVALSLAGLGLAFATSRRAGRSASAWAAERTVTAPRSTQRPPEPAGAPPRARL